MTDERFDALAEHFADRIRRTQLDLDAFANRIRAVRDDYADSEQMADPAIVVLEIDRLLRSLASIRP